MTIRKTTIISLIVLALIGVIYLSERYVPNPQESGDESRVVAATIFPIYDITRNIAGENIDVELILPPGASPHTFDPAPSTLRSLKESEAIYAIGHGLDNWASELSLGAQPVIIVDSNIELEVHEGEEHEEDEHGHEEGGVDPHYWLSIENGKQIARNVHKDLSMRFPEFEDELEENLAIYLDEMNAAQIMLKAEAELIPNKELVTFHDAWDYFAHEYGFEVVASFEPSAGQEPTPQYIAELTKALNESGNTAIYSEPQFGTAGLDQFAADNGLTIAELDPIGGIEDRESYLDIMKYNVEVIKDNQ